MHKFSRLALSISSLAILLSSCGGFQIPETIAIKTGAKYQVPLGTASYDLTSQIGSQAIRKSIQDSMGSSATVYDYISPEDSDSLNYLIRYNGMSVPVDIGSYLKDFNLDNALGDISKDFNLEAGSPINIKNTDPIQMPDFSDKLSSQTQVEVKSTEFAEGTAMFNSDVMPDAKVKTSSKDLSYSRVYYSAGKIQITFTKADSEPYSSDFKMEVIARLYEGDTVLSVSNNGAYQDLVKNPVLEIPMNCPEGLPSEFAIKFEGKTSGGSVEKKHKLSGLGIFKDAMPVKMVGVTADMAALGLPADALDQVQEIDLATSIPDAIKSVTFDNAKIGLKIANPAGWTGVYLDLGSDGLSIEGAAGSSLSETKLGGNYLINSSYVWGATIDRSTTSKLTVKIHPTLKVENATIILEEGKTSFSLASEIGVSLTDIKSATVDLTKLGAASISLPTDGSEGSIELPENLLKYVNGINFANKVHDSEGTETATARNGFGLKCKVTNTLPSGNDIGLKLQAFENQDAAGFYYSKDVTISSNSTEKDVEWVSYPKIKFPKYDAGVKKYLPFNVVINNADNFTVKNLKLGETYKMGIKLEKVIYDWDSVDLNLSTIGYKGNTGINFTIDSMMGDLAVAKDMIKNVAIHSFPMYIFAEKSAGSKIFKDMNLDGKLYVSYKDGDTTKYINILHDEQRTEPTDYELMKIVDSIPWPVDSEKTITGSKTDSTNIGYYLEKERCSALAELKEVLSLESVTEIKLEYDIKINGGTNKTVYASALDSSTNENLAVDYAMMLTFDFDLKAPIAVNIMEYANPDYNKPDEEGNYSDILGRTDASSTAEFNNYASAIDFMGLTYTVTNKLIKNLNLSAKINDANGKSGLTKDLTFESGEHEVKFSKDQIQSVMTNYPFHPDITIQLGRDLKASESGQYATCERLKLSREGANSKDALSAQMIVAVKMDHDTPITVWQQN